LKIYYNPALIPLARQLRNNSTLSEILLWKHLKNGQLRCYDFHRQKPIDQYIVDFFCPQLLLIIEIDGSSHDNKQEVDAIRQTRLESLGLSFLRFDDREVKRNMTSVIKAIEEWIERVESNEKQLP
jgi:very-short-patch-repair endonuclease